MTREDLIEELEKLPEGTEIFIYADHGQNHEDATSVELLSADEGDYYELEVDGPWAIIYGL